MIIAQSWSTLISAPFALALVAVLGYFVGRLRPKSGSNSRAQGRNEIARALAVAQELQSINRRLRKAVRANSPAVGRFNSRLSRMEQSSNVSWFNLCDRAEELLKPVLRLSSEISHAYAGLLQQMGQLATFAELRTDPLTGIRNRRAFDESLENLLAQQVRYGLALSVMMLDIDFFKRINDEKGHLQGDRVLQDLGKFLRAQVRDGDILARYGGEEFVVLMPHTDLHTACHLAERLRIGVQRELYITVSIGLAASLSGDTAATLLARADAALYLAKAAGRNCAHVHEGNSGRIAGIRSLPAQTPSRAVDSRPAIQSPLEAPQLSIVPAASEIG